MLHTTVYHGTERPDTFVPEDGHVVAVTFVDRPEWLGDAEGPPRLERVYSSVVRTAVGRVVRTFGRDERIMSDVWAIVTYAVVWDGAADFFEVSCHNSEFGAPDLAAIGLTSVTVDAPEALKAYHEGWELCREQERQEAERKAYAEAYRKRAEKEAKEPRKGRTCRVVKGRKVPVGTVGECIWIGEGRYGARVGIKDASGQVHWTAASNVEAVAA